MAEGQGWRRTQSVGCHLDDVDTEQFSRARQTREWLESWIEIVW